MFGFDGMFMAVSAVSILIFVAVFVIILITFARGLGQWSKNNHSPRLTVEAEVIGKRMEISHHRHSGEHHTMHSSTRYYVTFQVPSGDRMELHVPGQEYGLMIEGDFGDLSFQGTRFLSFARKAPVMDESC